MITAQHPPAIITSMRALPPRLAELPIELVESPIGPVLEGPGGLGLAGLGAAGTIAATPAAAAAVLGLDGAHLEVRARGVVDLLVRVRDVRRADQVARPLAAAVFVGLRYFDAHLCVLFLGG